MATAAQLKKRAEYKASLYDEIGKRIDGCIVTKLKYYDFMAITIDGRHYGFSYFFEFLPLKKSVEDWAQELISKVRGLK